MVRRYYWSSLSSEHIYILCNAAYLVDPLSIKRDTREARNKGNYLGKYRYIA